MGVTTFFGFFWPWRSGIVTAGAVSNVPHTQDATHAIIDTVHTDAMTEKQSPCLKVIIQNNFRYSTCQQISLLMVARASPCSTSQGKNRGCTSYVAVRSSAS